MKGLAIVFALFFSIIYTTLEGQSVGVSTNGAAPDQSAMLDVSSTSKGMLIPRMTSTQRAAITSPAEGLLVYDTNTDEVWYFSTTWRPIAGSGGLSDMDNDTKIIVEETTDDDKVRIYIAGEERVSIYDNTNGITRINVDAKGFNTLIGQLTGEELDNTIGSDAIQNVFVGFVSGRYCTTGYNNTFLGALAGMETTTGSYNTYLGQGAGLNHTGSGSSNTLVGGQAGSSMTTGFDNTILGYQAGYLRTGGQGNTLLGLEAGNTASGGSGNVMIGKRAGKGSTQSNSLYIDNTDTADPLIYGEFDNDILRVNGQLEVKVGGHEMAKFDGKTLHLMAPDSSLFIGKDAGLNDDGTTHRSTGIGFEALKNDATGWNNTAIGFQALSENDAGDNNTAIGVQAMHKTHFGDFNVAVGAGALFDNTSGANNVALGYHALRSNTGAKNNIAVGKRALFSNTLGEENISIGNSALYNSQTRDRNIAIGDSSLFNTGIASTGSFRGKDNIAIGNNAGHENENGYRNIAIGNEAFRLENDLTYENTVIGHAAGKQGGAGENTMIGAYAGENFADGEQNVFVGNYAGQNNVASQNTFIGYRSGKDNEGDRNVFIGYQAGENESSASNTLMIDNSDTSSPLIYGEFNNDLLRVNGALNINQAFTLPTVDGSADQVLKTDGSGNVSWGNSSGTIIEDADADTKISVELNPDEDIIRFSIAGVEVATLDADNFELDSGGESVFIGKNTGSNDDGTDNRNTAVGADVLTDNTTGYRNVALGRNALRKNTIGFTNVAIGNGALYENIDGDRNVALGYQSLYNATGSDNVAIGMYAGRNIGGSRNISIGFESNLHNAGGNNTIIGYHAGRGTSGDTKSGNVFLGYEAGKAETGSNKLIIENSSSAQPLIYGEFDNDLVRVNGELEIGDEYKFPGTDGSVDQVMKTDGSGNLTWGHDAVNDADASPTNEIQSLNVSGQELSISGGNTITLPVASPWGTNGNDIYFDDGKVIIGDQDADHKLSIKDNNSNTSGTDGAFMDIQNENTIPNVMSGIRFRNGMSDNTFKGGIYYQDKLTYGRGDLVFVNNSVGNNTNADVSDARMIIKNNGNILIGTETPATGYKVSIDGKVACEEVLVELSGDWPDYVFSDEYSLRSIDNLKQFVEKENHLPGISPASMMEQEGVQLGEMQRKLVEKVEELTLYIIQLNEQNKKQNQLIDQLIANKEK